MSPLPVRSGRLEDPVFLEEFRLHIVSELLELVTHPGSGYGSRASEIYTRFDNEGQLPLSDRLVDGMFVRCCQEISITPDEINQLQSQWFS